MTTKTQQYTTQSSFMMTPIAIITTTWHHILCKQTHVEVEILFIWQLFFDLVDITLQWRHNERHCVSNQRLFDCLLNRLLRCRLMKTSRLRITGLCEWNLPVTSEFPHKGPVTRKKFPMDDVTMRCFLNTGCKASRSILQFNICSHTFTPQYEIPLRLS